MKSKASLKKELRSLWYEIQHKLHHNCLVCDKPGVEVHHLISSSHIITAYDISNGIGLCPDHHRLNSTMSAHGRPEIFHSWLKEFAPDHYNYIIENENKIAHSIPIGWYIDKLNELKEISK